MCRITGYVGDSAEDLQNLFKVFSEGSECDPWLKKAGINHTSHKDGWGFAILDEKGLSHYRSALPVYEDTNKLPHPTGRFYALLHSRLGSDQSLNGHVCAHPFSGSTDEAFLFFAHNGGVDCGTLPKRMVDSEWAFKQILEAGGVARVLPLLKEKTWPNSALNLLILNIPRDPAKSPAIQYLNYFKEPKNEGRIGYYQMYTASLPGGKAVFSSTMADLGVKGASNVQKAAFGKLLDL